MSKNWKGNTNSIYKTLGASTHTKEDRQKYDFYATEPKATELLLELESFSNVWECACGEGDISKVLVKNGIQVKSTDIINRGYGDVQDFLCITVQEWDGDIVTNPPYIYAKDFVLKSLQIIPEGKKVAMFLKLLFMESKDRKELFKNFPPKTIYVSSSRLLCAKNGRFAEMKESGGAVAYAWYVWEKGFKGNTKIKWFN